MKTVLYGATGTIGQRIAAELQARGHAVETPRRDVLDPASVAAAATGADALLSAYGPGPSGDVQNVVRAAQALVDGARKSGVRRLLVVGGAGSLKAGGKDLIDSPQFPAAWHPIAQAHREALAVYQASGLDWTFYAPAALIEPGERTGNYRTGGGDLIADEKGQSRISAEDYAAAFVDELEKTRYVGKLATVAY